MMSFSHNHNVQHYHNLSFLLSIKKRGEKELTSTKYEYLLQFLTLFGYQAKDYHNFFFHYFPYLLLDMSWMGMASQISIL